MRTGRIHIIGAALLALWLPPGAYAAQTCNANIPRSAPDSRYTDNGDGTVTDKRTGLMWAKCVSGKNATDCSGTASAMDWKAALQAADSATLGGHNDWRLPNFKELISLVEIACADPAINLNLFPNTDAASYVFSASPSVTVAGSVRVVFFGHGGSHSLSRNFHNADLHVRLVRSGQ